MLTKSQKLNKIITAASVVVVFMLILIGGIVRSTGAGMGCPDWPKCFGNWVPPTNVSQLPADYMTKYAPVAGGSFEFNAVKTWTEYINRLFGMLTGFFVFAAALTSFTWWKKDRIITVLLVLSLLLIGFEGLVGAKVVMKNLAEHTVSIHLGIAYLIIALMIMAYTKISFINPSEYNFPSGRSKNNLVLGVTLAIVSSQILIGTFVRTEIDKIISNNDTLTRDQWVTNARTYLPGHKIFSAVVLLSCLYVATRFRELAKINKAVKIGLVLMLISLAGQFITGFSLYSFGFPAIAQPFHVLFSSIIFGSLIFILSYNNLFARKTEAEMLNRVHYA